MTTNHVLNTEAAILGHCLSTPGAAAKAARIITAPSLFTGSLHRKVYGAILACLKENDHHSVLTVSRRLAGDTSVADRPGGWIGYLTSFIPQGYEVASKLESSCLYLIDEALRWSAIGEAAQLQSDLNNASLKPRDLLGSFQSKLSQISSQASSVTRPSFGTSLEQAIAIAEESSKVADGIVGIRTGLEELDRYLKGLQPQTLTFIGARPGMGKTAKICQISHTVAVRMGIPVALFSLEMPAVSISRRMLAIETGLSNSAVTSGRSMGQAIDLGQLRTAASTLAKAPLHIIDNVRHIDQIAAECYQLVRHNGVKLIFIDYLTLIRSDGRQGLYERVTYLTQALKEMANSLGVPVVVLAHLSREVEKRPNKRPIMSDLRDSGSIEQDADNVLFLYRPGYYTDRDEAGNPINKELLYTIVAKNRNGSTHSDTEAISLHYQLANNRIQDWAAYEVKANYPDPF